MTDSGKHFIAVKVKAAPCTQDVQDLLADALGQEDGFDSFEYTDEGITAFCPSDLFEEGKVESALKDFPMEANLSWRVEKVEKEDWNAVWEKEVFVPIDIEGRCVVHASWHTDYPRDREFDICIDPEMSFGTGSHVTTRLIIGMLLRMNLKGCDVVDVGTGTGVLSFLCAMKGAASTVGIEIEEGAYNNACRNARANGLQDKVTLLWGDAGLLKGRTPADLLIANINRNVLLADMHRYAEAVKSGGKMILSGFLEEDREMMMEEARKEGFSPIDIQTGEEGWTAMLFSHK